MMNVRGIIFTMEMVFTFLVVLLSLGCSENLSKEFSDTANANPLEIQATVDNIDKIVGLSSKKDEQEWDDSAISIIALGKDAAPYLVEKITETTMTQVVEGFQYTIGDLALVLLNRIYEPQGWPFPDNSETIPQQFGDFRDYLDFINSQGARMRLQLAWKQYIKEN